MKRPEAHGSTVGGPTSGSSAVRRPIRPPP